jgi:hypothetical protein
MESDGNTRDTRVYTSSGRGGTLNPTPVVLRLLFVFVCSITEVIALSYVVDWN